MPTKRESKKGRKKSTRLPSHDLRRAYEHLGRIEILEGALAGVHFVHVSTLTSLAQKSLAAGHAQDAADLLRAAEHICFAALAPEERVGPVALISPALRASIVSELHELTQRGETQWAKTEHAPLSESIGAIFRTAIKQANSAFEKSAFRPALELARAAEALSHLIARSHAPALDSSQPSRLAS